MSKQTLSLPWTSRPSQWLNSTSYMTTAILIATVIYFEPLMYSYLNEYIDPATWVEALAIFCSLMLISPICKYIKLRSITYTITDDKIFMKTGVFSPETDPIEMFRVKDQQIKKPFAIRVFRLGNLTLHTSDHSMPIVNINAVRHVDALYSLVEKATNKARDDKGVREFD